MTKIEGINSQTKMDLGEPVTAPKGAKERAQGTKRRRKVTTPKRTEKIEIRVFAEEKEHIERLAQEVGRSPSEYIRELAKSRLTEVNVQDRIDKAVSERVKYLELEYQTRLSIALAEQETKVEALKKQHLRDWIRSTSVWTFLSTKSDLKAELKAIGNK